MQHPPCCSLRELRFSGVTYGRCCQHQRHRLQASDASEPCNTAPTHGFTTWPWHRYSRCRWQCWWRLQDGVDAWFADIAAVLCCSRRRQRCKRRLQVTAAEAGGGRSHTTPANAGATATCETGCSNTMGTLCSSIPNDHMATALLLLVEGAGEGGRRAGER